MYKEEMIVYMAIPKCRHLCPPRGKVARFKAILIHSNLSITCIVANYSNNLSTMK